MKKIYFYTLLLGLLAFTAFLRRREVARHGVAESLCF